MIIRTSYQTPRAKKNEPPPVEIIVYAHVETEKAFLVSLDGDKDNGEWVAKSQILDSRELGGDKMAITVPAWIIKKKPGLQDDRPAPEDVPF